MYNYVYGPLVLGVYVKWNKPITNLVNKSKPTSCDLDPLPTKVIKDHLDDFLPILRHIINCSLRSAKFPVAWKTAHVVPLLKKVGLDLVLQNYRPVSNLQFISKLVERAVVHQLWCHLDSNDLLPTHQSAYRAGHSTESALIKVQSDILMAMDQQKLTQLILIDLSAAFDTVDHNILADSMSKSFGIVDDASDWFSTYLRPRSQQVVINGSLSDPIDLHQGVPQGSCLGPIMFLEYSSPVFDLVSRHNISVHAYADDHQVYSSFDLSSLPLALSAMQDCVEDIRSWMGRMKLKMNDSKTEFIVFGSSHTLAKCPDITLSIGDSSIKPADCVRNLGALFDNKMTMEQHVKARCKAAYCQLYKIGKIRKYLDYRSAETLIHALVHSHIDYCNGLLYRKQPDSRCRSSQTPTYQCGMQTRRRHWRCS